jgi:20S proteasome alpha/beta subunit
VTTIVYRDGVMAADSLICDGGIRVGTVRKITRSADGGLVSACGNLNEMVRFQDWAARGFPADARPEMRAEDFEAVVAHPDGRIFWYDKDLLGMEMKQPYYAIGSGFELAMGALWMGASAEQAIRCATELDVHSGGDIQVERLGSR